MDVDIPERWRHLEPAVRTTIERLQEGRTRYEPGAIRDDVLWAITCWVVEGRLPGHFLQAVLRNDLGDALGRADGHNVRYLGAIYGLLYNRAPSACFGSPGAVDAWQQRGGLYRLHPEST
jgi:hypothetical protein